MRMTVVEQVLKARDSNEVTVAKVSSVVLRFRLNSTAKPPPRWEGRGLQR